MKEEKKQEDFCKSENNFRSFRKNPIMRRSRKIVSSVLISGMLMLSAPMQVFAAEGKTPSGIPFDEVGDRITAWAEENADEYPSFAVAVVNREGLVYSGAFGYTDIENGIAATPDDSVYEWGSCSKTMIWVSVMQLWEQGRIDLDEDIRNYLPQGFFKKLTYDDPITMINLMNHDAGWSESTWAFQADDESKIMDLGESIEYAEPVQIYRPGEVSSYSNYGAAVAGYVVECITGQPYWEYVHENIFEPLGMEHTSIKPAHDDCQWVYERRKNNFKYSKESSGWKSKGHQLVFIMPYPAGAACGSIEDMALYCSALAREDCPLLGKEAREKLFSASMSYEYGDTTAAEGCHGFWPDKYEYASTLGHSGGTNGGSANLEFDLDSGVGVVTLMNGSGEPHHAMDEIVFGAAVNEAPEISGSSSGESDLPGLCISARAMRRGPMRFISMLGIMPVTRVSENEYSVVGMYTLTGIDKDIYFLSGDGVGELARYSVIDDDTQVINMGSSAYVTEKGLYIELLLLVFYALCVVTAAVILIVKLIRLIAKKNKSYPGAGIITAAQFAKLVSAGVIAAWLSVFSHQYGLYKSQGVTGCVIQMICFAVCIISAVISVKSLFTAENGKIKYIMNMVSNILFSASMAVFELMNFWNC